MRFGQQLFGAEVKECEQTERSAAVCQDFDSAPIGREISTLRGTASETPAERLLRLKTGDEVH